MDDLKTLDILLDALKALDELLVSENQHPIEIRAIGGFALAFRNIREDGLTRDIDTITPDYPPSLARLIVKVAELIGLEHDWLNNDAVGSIDGLTSRDAVMRHDAMLDARYEEVPLGFKKITLRVADLGTLMRSKLYAVDAISLGARGAKDAQDLEAILNKMGFSNIDAAVRSMPWLDCPEFKNAIETMRRFERGDSLVNHSDTDDLDDFLRDILSSYENQSPEPEYMDGGFWDDYCH